MPVTPTIALLLVANIVFFVLQNMGAEWLVQALALWPLLPEAYAGIGDGRIPSFQIWQLLSYAFLHGSFTHIFFNMFALWMFGTQIERHWGPRRFVFFYFFCVVGAGLVQLYVATQLAETGQIYPTVGASGGVFGVLLAFGMLFPNQRIMLLIPPIPIKAKWFVLIYGAIELWLGVTATAPGIAHFAHLGGMLFGFLLIMYWRGRLPIRPTRLMP